MKQILEIEYGKHRSSKLNLKEQVHPENYFDAFNSS